MMKYEVVKNENATIIKRTNEDESVSWIPADPANSDYQRYLRWLENPDADEAQSLQIVFITNIGGCMRFHVVSLPTFAFRWLGVGTSRGPRTFYRLRWDRGS